MFDAYLIVDWSAANHPKTGRDSIWIGSHDRQPVNLATRSAARSYLAERFAEAIDGGKRVLVGFDFPFGYPAGFAVRLGLAGAPWRAVWDEIARLIADGADNRNNRFEVGAELNRRISNGRFPFWGCPVGPAREFLGPRHHQLHHDGEPLKERRLIDEWMTGAQPCWKLAYTGSVGSQALTGIPAVRALRDDPCWAAQARVWPFETGLRPPAEDTRIVFAEVWPSWWRDWKGTREPGEVNDRAQVRHVARVFAEADAAGRLAAVFAGDPGLTAAQRAVVEREEAWTLGVIARRERTTRPRAASPDRAASAALVR